MSVPISISFSSSVQVINSSDNGEKSVGGVRQSYGGMEPTAGRNADGGGEDTGSPKRAFAKLSNEICVSDAH